MDITKISGALPCSSVTPIAGQPTFLERSPTRFPDEMQFTRTSATKERQTQIKERITHVVKTGSLISIIGIYESKTQMKVFKAVNMASALHM